MFISKLFNPLKTWSHGVVNTHVSFHVCYVLSCFVCMLYVYICIYLSICIFVCVYIYIYIYVCMFHIYVYLYVWVYICIFICASLYVCVCTHFCLYENYLFNYLSCRHLGCYLLVWHRYLGSILAFSFEIVKLNTTTGTKSSTQVIKVSLGNMNSLFLTLIVSNSGCMYLFIQINSDWLIDWFRKR